jgi:hypothetical protein
MGFRSRPNPGEFNIEVSGHGSTTQNPLCQETVIETSETIEDAELNQNQQTLSPLSRHNSNQLSELNLAAIHNNNVDNAHDRFDEEEATIDRHKRRRRRRAIPKMKDLARAQAKRMKKKKKKKRQQSKSISEEKGGDDISVSLNQVNVSINSSFSGEISEWRKWVCLQENPDVVANNVWQFGKKEGVNFSEDEGIVVKELEGIEIRDRGKISPANANRNQTKEGGETNLGGR